MLWLAALELSCGYESEAAIEGYPGPVQELAPIAVFWPKIEDLRHTRKIESNYLVDARSG